ncbi:MAG: GspE/PulE family protein [Pirellulales bacterium]
MTVHNSDASKVTPDFREITFAPEILPKLEPSDAVLFLLQYASHIGASDVFFEPDLNYVTIAVRRMGTIERVGAVSHEQGRQMITHIKASAGMDISERRRPCDGRWILVDHQRRLDVRINTMATLYGEDMALRLWSRQPEGVRLEALGIPDRELSVIKSMLSSPSGLVLVTGPTGTGKTTTLYSCLQFLNDGTRKINTLEDPIEYAIDGVRQSQANTKIGLDFAEMLRNVLRQAPDVIMIGEVRDSDTATAVVRAANSGHLVLATLHAPVAAAAVQSLLVLGAQPFFLANCLLGVISQRLIRTLCPACRVAYDISDSPATFQDLTDLIDPTAYRTIYGPGRCDACRHTGYVGRTGLFEVMSMNPELRQIIARNGSSKEIEQVAIRAGMIEFRRGAMLAVAHGTTSTEEILREVPAEYLGLE